MGFLWQMLPVQFLVDAEGKKKAVVLEYSVWKKLLTLLEDPEDTDEVRCLREAEEETIPWEEVKAKLEAAGVL
jgi:macrodomain Ter protein organizer (MatP/YcbG family)